MEIQRENFTLEQIHKTNAYKNADGITKRIYYITLYLNKISDYMTVVKYKGLDYVLNLYHMTDFKRELITELSKRKP